MSSLAMEHVVDRITQYSALPTKAPSRCAYGLERQRRNDQKGNAKRSDERAGAGLANIRHCKNGAHIRFTHDQA